MSRLLVALVVCLTAAAAPLAQSQGAQLRMDTGTFRYSADQSLAEVYLSVGASSLRYTKSASGSFEASVPVHLAIRPVAAAAPAGAQQAPAFEQALDFRFSVADTSALEPGQIFTEQVRAALAPGEYKVVATIPAGSASPRRVDVEKDIAVPDYTSAEPRISSLQLARRVARAQSETDDFFKSGYIVQPYPEPFFGGDLSRVTYYAEVYGVPEAMGEYTVLAYLSDSSRPTPIEGTETRTARRVQPVDVVLGGIDVAGLPTGEYVLHLAALNASNEAVAEQSKRLFVINPDVPQPERNVAIAENDELLYSAMGEEELALNVDHARVLVNSRQRQQINALSSDEERRNFLVRFWRDRNSSPLTAAGVDARREFYNRLTRVNDTYRFGNRAGYKTDRGRVYLTYGPPSGIDRQAFNADSAPFEVWSYENIPGEGFAEFVFVDRYNSGEMQLVHSTVTGEVSLPNWQRELTNR